VRRVCLSAVAVAVVRRVCLSAVAPSTLFQTQASNSICLGHCARAALETRSVFYICVPGAFILRMYVLPVIACLHFEVMQLQPLQQEPVPCHATRVSLFTQKNLSLFNCISRSRNKSCMFPVRSQFGGCMSRVRSRIGSCHDYWPHRFNTWHSHGNASVATTACKAAPWGCMKLCADSACAQVVCRN